MDYQLMGRGNDGNVYAIGGGGMKIRYMERGDYPEMTVSEKSYTCNSTTYQYTSSNKTSSLTEISSTRFQGSYFSSTQTTTSQRATSTVTIASISFTTSLFSYGTISYSYYGSASYSMVGEITAPNVIGFPIRHTIVNPDLVDCVFGERFSVVNNGASQPGNYCSYRIHPYLNNNAALNVNPNNVVHPTFNVGDTAIKVTYNLTGRPEDSVEDRVHAIRFYTTYYQTLSTPALQLSEAYSVSSSLTMNYSTAQQYINQRMSQHTSNYSHLTGVASVTNELRRKLSTSMSSYLQLIDDQWASTYRWNNGSFYFHAQTNILETSVPKITAALRDYLLVEYK